MSGNDDNYVFYLIGLPASIACFSYGLGALLFPYLDIAPINWALSIAGMYYGLGSILYARQHLYWSN